MRSPSIPPPAWALALTLLLSCGDDDGTASSGAQGSSTTAAEPSTGAAASTGMEAGTSSATAATGATGADSSTGSSADAPYGPCDDAMQCPDDQLCAGFGGRGMVCMPVCTGPKNMCPEPESGTAEPFCGVNTLSSQDRCTMEGSEDECAVAEEICQPTGGGSLLCLLPPTHCILLCAPMGDCPEGMACSPAGVCQWEP